MLDYDILIIIRRLNLGAFWPREPTTIALNLRSLAKLATMYEVVGTKSNLPALYPMPFLDKFGYFVPCMRWCIQDNQAGIQTYTFSPKHNEEEISL